MTGQPSLNSLSTELLENILDYLSISDLVACSQLCRHIRSVIEGSTRLQYSKELGAGGYVPRSTGRKTLPGDRVSELVQHERAWSSAIVRVARKAIHKLPLEPQSGPEYLYALPNYLFAYSGVDFPASVMALVRPNHSKKGAMWSALDLGQDAASKKVLAIAGALDEDLLVVLLLLPGWPASLEMRLFSLSSRTAHPDAASPVLTLTPPGEFDVVNGNGRAAQVPIFISGENIFFNLKDTYHNPGETSTYCLLWQQGSLVLLRTGSDTSFIGIQMALIRDDLLLFTRPDRRRLEIYHLSSDVSQGVTARPLLHLALPDLAQDAFLRRIDIQTGSTPTRSSEHASASPLIHASTFAPDPALAIIQLQFSVAYKIMHSAYTTDTFTCLLSSRSLLKLADAAMKKPADSWDPPHATARRWKMAGEAASCFASGEVASDLHTESVSWKDWGPASTRWFATERNARGFEIRDDYCSYGQRTIAYSSRPQKAIRVLDFNPYNVRKAMSARPPRSGDPVLRVVSGPTTVPKAACWKNDIVSALPYVESELHGTGKRREEMIWTGRELVRNVVREVKQSDKRELVVDIFEVC